MFSIVIISIFFFLNIVWIIYHHSSKPKSKIPGVTPSDPELGNLVDIRRIGSLHQYLTKLHKKLGPVVSFHWGKQRVVSIASPGAFHATRHLFDQPVSLFAAYKPFIGANSIQYANGDTGRNRRKHHYDAALSLTVLRTQLFDSFQHILREKLKSWQLNQEKSIALHTEMLSMAIKSIIVLIFGSSILVSEEKNIENAYNTCYLEIKMRTEGYPTDSKREAEFNQARNYFSQKVKEIIAERHQRSNLDDKCFIDYLLDDKKNVVSEEHICDEVITMFIGGFHTTGNILTWILYYLAKHENIQERLYDELIQTYDTEFPSFDQIDQMPYLTNIINESLRLSVLAPWAGRVSKDKNIIIDGKTIPAGTPIIQALGVVLQDEKIWTNPHEFNPDRFNEENKNKIPTLAFSPFGFSGQRICPGYRFAQYEVILFIAGIIRMFKITLVDPTAPVVPVHGLVTSPKEEIFVQFSQGNY